MIKQLQSMKDELKTRATEIRTLRNEYRESFRNGTNDGFLQFRVESSLKDAYRHMHIAYCELRGTPYERIEPKVREGNEPDRSLIESIKAKYLKEVEDDQASDNLKSTG